MSVTTRLAELGIVIPAVAKPVASYVPAKPPPGNLVFTAGQLPFVDGSLPATGKVGAVRSVQRTPRALRGLLCSMLSRLRREQRLGRLTALLASSN